MKILILGGGGREHALAWAVSQNPKCEDLFCAPGNAGIEKLATCVALNILDKNSVVDFCKKNKISFVIIGSEAPLEIGIADALESEEILTFGPSSKGSLLESSKAFTKEVCRLGKIPTAPSRFFNKEHEAIDFINASNLPIVIKADGLAAGKGVTIAASRESAFVAIKDLFGGKFGSAGKSVIVEDFLEGEEASFFVLCDGQNILPLGTAQDHKRAFDGEKGPNTGGMGAYSPATVISKVVEERILSLIIKPTIQIMNSKGIKFKGVLYAGLMIKNEQPTLLEYNVRFGDPECQVLAMRLGAQLLDLLLDCASGDIEKSIVNWANDSAISIVMASKGYPGNYEKGSVIRNVEAAEREEGVQVFHAGTINHNNELLANGGRVLNVTGRANTLKDARDLAYKAVQLIDWDEGFYRKDIGWRALG